MHRHSPIQSNIAKKKIYYPFIQWEEQMLAPVISQDTSCSLPTLNQDAL